MLAVDDLLRGSGRHSPSLARLPWGELAATIVIAGFIQGSVMGFHGGRWLQALYSGLKVPFLLLVSTLICLPSFYVINTLLGLRADFGAACRAVVAAQSALAVCLAALSPLVIVLYASTGRYLSAIVFNGVLFAAAAAGGQIALGRSYRGLIAADPRHRWARAAWLSLYVFVAIQMAWVLRPFVGVPGLPTRLLRPEAWSNAYVEVIKIVWRWLSGL